MSHPVFDTFLNIMTIQVAIDISNNYPYTLYETD